MNYQDFKDWISDRERQEKSIISEIPFCSFVSSFNITHFYVSFSPSLLFPDTDLSRQLTISISLVPTWPLYFITGSVNSAFWISKRLAITYVQDTSTGWQTEANVSPSLSPVPMAEFTQPSMPFAHGVWMGLHNPPNTVLLRQALPINWSWLTVCQTPIKAVRHTMGERRPTQGEETETKRSRRNNQRAACAILESAHKAAQTNLSHDESRVKRAWRKWQESWGKREVHKHSRDLAVPRGMPGVHRNTPQWKLVERKQPTLWESGTDWDNMREGVSAQGVARRGLATGPKENQGLPQSIMEYQARSLEAQFSKD